MIDIIYPKNVYHENPLMYIFNTYSNFKKGRKLAEERISELWERIKLLEKEKTTNNNPRILQQIDKDYQKLYSKPEDYITRLGYDFAFWANEIKLIDQRYMKKPTTIVTLPSNLKKSNNIGELVA